MEGCIGAVHHAAEVLAQRRPDYGPPAEHFKQVARRWSLTLGTTVRPEQVILCLIDLKVARLAHGMCRHRDSLVDLIGCSALLHELVRMRQPWGVLRLLNSLNLKDAPGLSRPRFR